MFSSMAHYALCSAPGLWKHSCCIAEVSALHGLLTGDLLAETLG
jgi:hypothetical protein